jgi:NTP pyrophosphatase (non-canonical NTP hydrolase)
MELKYLAEIKSELFRASATYHQYHSEHEGFAVLLEEVDELWEAVRLKQSDPTRKEKVRDELIQIAATAHRFLNDLC